MRKLFNLFIFSVLALNLSAQTNDSVSVGPGYTNQTFYSLSKGMISSVSNTNWELGFAADKKEVSILINSKNGVKLYLASNDTTKWTTVDTAGTISTALQLHNSDSNWSNGAFNRVPANTFNYGWGTYDMTTHVVNANNIYFISYSNGTSTVWKKLIISKHSLDYKYYFRYADLNGANETSVMIDKNNYAKRNFVYYSLNTNAILDREPNNSTYDLIFCQYEQEIPFYYPITGALLNIGVKAKFVYPVDKNAADFHNYTLSKNISEVGGAWKVYNFGTNLYDMKDSTVCFIQDVTGKIWKLVFTGFAGAATGNIYFTKTAVGTNGISGSNSNNISLGIYPNPGSGNVSLNYYSTTTSQVNIMIKDITGRTISTSQTEAKEGFNQFGISTNYLSNGNYLVQVIDNSGITSTKLTIQH